MATNFPGSLDSFTNPSSSSTLDSPSHAAQHANINDAMVAVQAKLGVGAGTIGEWTSYTPTVTSQTGTITSYTASGAYAIVNKIAIVKFQVAISNKGTAGGAMYVTVPVTIDTTNDAGGNGGWVEYSTVGETGPVFATGGMTTYVGLLRHDWSTPFVSTGNFGGTAIVKVA